MPRDPQKKLERLLTFQKFLQEHYEEQRKAAQRHPTGTSTSSAEDDKLGKEQNKVELDSHDHAQLPQARPAQNTGAEGKSGSLLLTGIPDPASSTSARAASTADLPKPICLTVRLSQRRQSSHMTRSVLKIAPSRWVLKIAHCHVLKIELTETQSAQ